jgi:hypothetical protein
MAVATSILARDATALKRMIALLTFSGTYTTGGEAPTNGFLKDFAMSRMLMVVFSQSDGAVSGGVVAQYDHTNNKVKLFEGGAAADSPNKELTSGQSLTGVIVRAEFIGEGNN